MRDLIIFAHTLFTNVLISLLKYFFFSLTHTSCMILINKILSLNIEAILAVMNTTELVVEMRPDEIQARTGFKPMTSAIPLQRSTN